MNAVDFITGDIPVLHPDQTVGNAQDIFIENCVCHLPITKEDKFIGLLPSDAVFSEETLSKKISQFQEDFIPAFAYGKSHILNLFQIVAEHELTTLPVLDENNNYLGLITTTDLLHFFSDLYAFKEPGGIFTLEMGIRDYLLSEIVRIVESDNAKILTLFTYLNKDATKIFVTVKVNKTNLQDIRASFERFNYSIEVFEDFDQDFINMKDRYDLLMKYLSI